MQEKPRRLPRGANSLPKEVVLKTQRSRLIEAAGRAVAERGYGDTAVSHILAHAGISRAAFYELFKDKEDCFLQGFHDLARSHLRSVEKAMERAGSLPEQLVGGISAYLQFLDLSPVLARAYVLEAEAASPAIRAALAQATGRVEALIQAWFRRVQSLHPEVPECPELRYRALRSGLTGVLMERIRGDAPRLPIDVAALATFVLATLGLYRWARSMESGVTPIGQPRGSAARLRGHSRQTPPSGMRHPRV